MKRHSIALTAFLLLAPLGVGGCSGASTAAPSTANPPSSASAPAGTSDGDSGAPQTDATDESADSGGSAVSCSQLTKDDVQPLLAEPISTIDAIAAGTDDEGQECIFGGDTDGTIDVTVYRGDDATQAYQEAIQDEADGPVDVPGVGDKATRDTGDPEISSLKDDLFCGVSLGSAEDVPGIAALEQAAGDTTNVPESAYATAAVALGTLCNRIYGSGNTVPDLSSLPTGSAAAAPTTG